MADIQIHNNVDIQGQKVKNAADGSANSDYATWGQVQNLVQGVTKAFHAETRASGNVDIATLNNGDTVNGEVVATGDSVLLDLQTTAAEDGLYTVGATEGTTVRHAQLPSGASWEGVMVRVSGGNDGGKTFFSTGEDLVVGTDGVTMVEQTGGTSYTAGDGLSESPAGTFNVAVGAGLELSSDTVRVAAAAAGAGLTGGAGSALAVGAGTGITVNANDVAVDTSVVGMKFSTATHASSTSITITHNLGTENVVVSVRLEGSPKSAILVDWDPSSTNAIVLRPAVAPSANTWRITVIG